MLQAEDGGDTRILDLLLRLVLDTRYGGTCKYRIL